MADPASPAAALLLAAARARSLRGRVTVVKLGGSALEDPAATTGMLESLAALNTLGVKLVVVHGGGKPIDRAMAAANIEPVKIQGRRYTDDKTLEIVVRVLGEINAGLVRDLVALGGGARGFADFRPFPLRGERLMLAPVDLQPIDLGRVGRVTSVDYDLIDEALTGLSGVGARETGIAVLPSLAVDLDGGWLNVNADTAAAAVFAAIEEAGHEGADVLFLTDTPGVLLRYPDPTSRADRLTRAECDRLIRDGVIAGGMIPKVEACFEALDAGAGRAVILDGRDPHALLAEFVGLPRPGTEIVP